MKILHLITQKSGEGQDLGVLGEIGRGLEPRFTKIGD